MPSLFICFGLVSGYLLSRITSQWHHRMRHFVPDCSFGPLKTFGMAPTYKAKHLVALRSRPGGRFPVDLCAPVRLRSAARLARQLVTTVGPSSGGWQALREDACAVTGVTSVGELARRCNRSSVINVTPTDTRGRPAHIATNRIQPHTGLAISSSCWLHLSLQLAD